MRIGMDELIRLEEFQENVCTDLCKYYKDVVSGGIEDPTPCRECPLNKLDGFVEDVLARRVEAGIAQITDSVVVITAAGDIRVKEMPITLANLQEAVGGYIETVKFEFGSYSFLMVVNEEGKIKDLPFNLCATKLYNRYRTPADPIFGDVVILRSTKEELIGLSRSEILYLMDYDRIMEVLLDC